MSLGSIPGPVLAPWMCPGGFLSALLLTGMAAADPPGSIHPHWETVPGMLVGFEVSGGIE